MDTVVRVASSAKQANEYLLVLEAIDIAHRLEQTEAGWAVMVAAADAARARRSLAAYDAEAQEESRPRPPSLGYGRTWIGAVVAALLIACFVITGGRDRRNVWHERGSASAEHILRGEVWRTVTSLTLHADLVHVLSNALACVILITAVGWWFGPGLGICLVLLAGVGGNALAALAYGAHQKAIGASTATFGALGILAARQFMERRRHPWSKRTAWVAAAAGLALLGMLGTAPGSDILAHFFGLLVGGGLGVGAALMLARPPRPSMQWTLLLAAAALVTGSWWVALAGVPHR
jgi:membrane associated rhomboid family serine protease